MGTNSERILVVGGDGDQARRAGTILNQAGYKVSFAHRLPIALEILKEIGPRLVVIGQQLPTHHFPQILKAARTSLPRQSAGGLVLACEDDPGDDAGEPLLHETSIPTDFSARQLLDAVHMILHQSDLLEAYHEELENLKNAHRLLRERFARAVLEGHYLSSDLDRLEDELLQLEAGHDEWQDEGRCKALSELAGAISHELNQPLAIIIGRIQLMVRRSELEGENKRNLAIIEEQAKRMADIIRKIGKIHEYSTKPYIRGHRIIDIEESSRSH